MAPKDDNAKPPLLNDRGINSAILSQLEKLNEAFEEQKDFMKSVLSPTEKGNLESQMDATAKQQRSKNAPSPLPPGFIETSSGQIALGGADFQPREDFMEKNRRELQERLSNEQAKVRKFEPRRSVVIPTEVGPIERAKQGWARRKQGGTFTEGYLEPENVTGGAFFNPEALPPNATGVGRGTTGYKQNIPGDPRQHSPIKGMTMAEYESMRQDGFKIPEFGDWQLDTKLRMGRDWIAGMAESHGAWSTNLETGEPEWTPYGTTAGRIAQKAMGVSGYLHNAQSHAAQIQAVKNMIGRGQSWMGETSEMGSYMGYSPQNGLGPNYMFGIHNPLSMFTSSAGQQGLGMRMNAYQMSTFGTGLSTEQAQGIVSALAKNGWSNSQSNFLGMTTGGNLNNIATQGVAPIVKNTGMNAEVAAGLYEPLRYGNTSIEQIRDSLTGMAQAAQAAHININAFGQTLQQFAAEQGMMGGTAAQSYATGIQWAQNTNLSPGTLSKLQSNPFYQGLALTRSGVLPSGIGGLSGGAQEKLAGQSLQLLMKATRGLAKPVYENVNGERYQIENGEKAHIAQVAQIAGISMEEAEKLIGHKKQIMADAKIETVLKSESGWAADLKHAEESNKKHGLDPKALSQEQRNLLQRGGGGVTGWTAVERTLKEAGMSSSELSHISHEGFDKRQGDVEKFMRSKGQQEVNATGQKVEVKFTGAAAKYFEQAPLNPAKAGQNAGGNLLSEFSAGAMTLGQMAGGASNPIGGGLEVAGAVSGVIGKIL